MTFEIIQVSIILILAVILFATEKIRVDLVALLIMGSLLLIGIISPSEAVQGFSNTATVTIAGMFILSAGLYKSGVVEQFSGKVMQVFQKNFWLGIISMMVFVGVLSAFINNTAVVAIFLPVVLSVSRKLDLSSAKLLMPLSFASMFGGVCTLIGTSTNILVNSMMADYKIESFGMFEFTGLGLIFFGAGIIYMVAVGIHIIPDRGKNKDMTETFDLKDYLTEIVLLPGAASVDKKLKECPLVKDMDIDILEVIRDKKRVSIPHSDTILRANDVLRVRANVEKIKELQKREGVELKAHHKWKLQDLESEDIKLIEAVISPNSRLAGKTLKDAKFRNNYGATVLAIRHRGTLMNKNIGNTVLNPGDTLLIEIQTDRFDFFRNSDDFVLISELSYPTFRKNKIIPSVLIAAGVIISASVGIFPIMVSVVLGCILMVLTGCIKLEEAYGAIDWKIIFLLAGALSMGVAIEKTGMAELLSIQLVDSVGGWGPIALVSVFYITTSLMTESISNNATAVIMTPIAIAAAESMGISSKPLLITIMFAASSSFLTPVGYQTNTLIYSAGQYKFTDFTKVGAPLNLLFWILATFLIPVFFPF
ncbi:MAG TPA: SLC13 family permease [Ignavibacteria bacterium]|nr:SLC13 family permease [Ignavibacteria bacterium]